MMQYFYFICQFYTFSHSCILSLSFSFPCETHYKNHKLDKFKIKFEEINNFIENKIVNHLGY